MHFCKGHNDMNEYFEAKEIFYGCYGSRSSIDKEYGKLYSKYNVPKEIEEIWLKDIKSILKEKICQSSSAEQHRYVTYLCDISEISENIDLLLILLQQDIDSFTRLLYCEKLISLIKKTNNATYNKIRKIIIDQRKIILSNISDIDDSYKKLSYMKDYDFSVGNLIKRIDRLF